MILINAKTSEEEELPIDVSSEFARKVVAVGSLAGIGLLVPTQQRFAVLDTYLEKFEIISMVSSGSIESKLLRTTPPYTLFLCLVKDIFD